MDVPTNLDARRRITFFANSLFMKMPRAPQVHDMISFRCVFYLMCYCYSGSMMSYAQFSEANGCCTFLIIYY